MTPTILTDKYPSMARLTAGQKRADLRALALLVGAVGEERVAKAIAVVRADPYRCAWAANWTRLLEKWSEVEVWVETQSTKRNGRREGPAYVAPPCDPDPEKAQREYDEQMKAERVRLPNDKSSDPAQ